MSPIQQALARFAPWREPGTAGGTGELLVRCIVDPPATPEEVRTVFANDLPDVQAVELWGATRTARLFEDVEYGQWGLILLPPAEAARRSADERRARPGDYLDDDIVIGEFLGDQDLLVIAPSEGRVAVSLPLDPRRDWPTVAANLAEFLERFADAQGAKYWEPSIEA